MTLRQCLQVGERDFVETFLLIIRRAVKNVTDESGFE